MTCECSLNSSIFLYDLLNTNINNIQFNYNLADFIGEFSPQTSGVWMPAFYGEIPQSVDGKNWKRVTKGRTSETPVDECTDVSTPNGLGLADFASVSNVRLRHWTVTGNLNLTVNWIINFKTCKEYTSCVLFWYRHYDINRNDDDRLIPGVDIYVSDGDYAYVDEEPSVTDNLLPEANRIYQQLIDSGYDENAAELNAKILSSGPAIDNITDSLYFDPDGLYNRDGYFRILPFVSGMSDKNYGDIGKKNFIVTKYDLLSKLVSKYGSLLEVPENSQINMLSNFVSETGPNIEIQLDGDLYRSDPEVYSGYNIGIQVGDLSLKALNTQQIFVPKAYDSVDKITVYGNNHYINSFTLNDKIIGYNLIDSVSGIWNPDLSVVRFHGLGGIDWETTSLFGESCTAGTSLSHGLVIYSNTKILSGPFFDPDYETSPDPDSVLPDTIEKQPSRIGLSIQTSTNAKFVFNDQINITYLRSENKPDCPSFIGNKGSCNCFNLGRLGPTVSGTQADNTNDLLFTPSTSLYYLPSGNFYGGLNSAEVATYGIYPPNHPLPGTPIPKVHTNFFPTDENCSLTMNGCGSQTFSFYMPYPGKVLMKYESSKAYFHISSSTSSNKGSSATSPPGSDGGIFTGKAGVLCMDKKIADNPQVVNVTVAVPAEQPDTQWGIQISGIQYDYTEQIPFGDGLVLLGNKGFFHPNFGFTTDVRYRNLSPIVPNHRNAKTRTIRTEADVFTLTIRYDDTYPGEGPMCAGGHGCNRAKFDIYANDTYIGTANLNNAGGPEDPGPAGTRDRIAKFTIPSTVGFINGNQIELKIQCAYRDNCHAGVANVSIQNSKGQYLFRQCIATDAVVPVTLDLFSLPIYNYNAHAMYNNDFLKGYNYMFDLSSYSSPIVNTFLKSAYIGVKTASNSFYVTKNFSKIQYIPSQCPILESVPFNYLNLDTKDTYPLNDIKYNRAGPNSVTIASTIEDKDRAIAYIDQPPYAQESFYIYGQNPNNDQNIISFHSMDDNTLYTNSIINSPRFNYGSIARNREGQTTWSSVLVYRSNTTINDHIQIGKWGNHSYSEAIYEFYKFLSEEQTLDLSSLDHLHNNSYLRDTFSRNTSFSWGSPIVFYNGYNLDPNDINLDTFNSSDPDIVNITTRYTPVSRLFNVFDNNGLRNMHVVGSNNIYDSAMPDGDRIIASGSLGSSSKADIYLGSYLGPLEIKIELGSVYSTSLGTLQLFHETFYNGVRPSYPSEPVLIAEEPLSSHENGIITININKDVELSRYAQIVINYSTDQCGRDLNNRRNSNFTPKLLSYTVRLDNSSEELRQRSRISYYAHKNQKLQNYKPSFANNFPGQAIKSSNGQIIAPLYENITYKTDKAKDYGSYLDMHIFSENYADKPIRSESGVLFFDDFLKPKSNYYIENQMQIPYNSNLYWIDIPHNTDWSLLTSKGFLLDSGKVYKVLASLEYTCAGDAEKCADRYPENICNSSYRLSLNELYEFLGLSAEDVEILDITNVSFPGYCQSINYCCDKYYLPGTSEYSDCISREITGRENCREYWSAASEVKVTCISDTCPTNDEKTNLSGTITSNASYWIIKVNNNLSPNLDYVNNSNFHFFVGDDVASFPCSIETFPAVGKSYKYSYSCEQIDNKCDSIIPQNFTVSSQFVPGEMLNIAAAKRQEITSANPVPYSVILENELTYRNTFDHPNTISLPLKEYDTADNSYFLISHQFTIKSKKCTNGPICEINIGGAVCSFSLENTNNGTVLRSPCFDEQVIEGIAQYEQTITLNKTICERHTCPSYDGCTSESCFLPNVSCSDDWSCEDAAAYISSTYGEDAELVSCTETSNPEDYYLDCRLCDRTLVNPDGEPCTTNFWASVLQYKLPVEQQCFCPEGTTPSDNYHCEFEYDSCYDQKKTGFTYQVCAPAGYEPSEADIEAYNNACGTENIRTSTSYSVVWTQEAPHPSKVYEQSYLHYKDYARRQALFSEAQNQYAECTNACSKQYYACGGSWNENCVKQLYACSCPCEKAYREASAAIELTRNYFYYCNDNCGWSDNISLHGYYNFDNCPTDYYNGWYGWYWYTDYSCDQNPLLGKYSTSYNDYDYSNGKYIKDCDYTPCSNLAERVTFNRRIYGESCECVTNYGGYTYLQCSEGECKPTNWNDMGTEIIEWKSHVVEYETITKTKRPPVTKFEDRESKYSNAKVYSKSFDIKYKSLSQEENDEDPSSCNPPCDNGQKCCDGVCREDCCVDKADLSFTVTFDIYRNMIVGTMSGSQNKLYIPFFSSSFSCPTVKYTILNDDVYICDSVSSDCYSCFLGGINEE